MLPIFRLSAILIDSYLSGVIRERIEEASTLLSISLSDDKNSDSLKSIFKSEGDNKEVCFWE